MKKIVFYGDSITERFKQLNELPNVKNMGVGGDKTLELIGRFNSVALEQPDQLFVLVGINDFLVNKGKWGDHLRIPLLDTYHTFFKMLKMSLKNTEINILAIFPLNVGGIISETECPVYNGEIDELNQEIKQMAESFDMKFIDLTASFKDESNALKEEYTIDGIHLSDRGYEVYFELIQQYFIG